MLIWLGKQILGQRDESHLAVTDSRMVVESTQPAETAKDWQAKHGLH